MCQILARAAKKSSLCLPLPGDGQKQRCWGTDFFDLEVSIPALMRGGQRRKKPDQTTLLQAQRIVSAIFCLFFKKSAWIKTVSIFVGFL